MDQKQSGLDEVVEKVDETEHDIEEQSADDQSNEESELQAATRTIEELKKQLEEAENKQLRVQADFENFRRRLLNEKQATEKYRAQSIATELLPALDNFERALKLAQRDDSTRSFIQGMEMIYKSIMEALKKEGVEPIESVAQPFDPHLHQAVMQEQTDDYDSNIVIEEFQKGYMLKDRVIRPAMVKVSE